MMKAYYYYWNKQQRRQWTLLVFLVAMLVLSSSSWLMMTTAVADGGSSNKSLFLSSPKMTTMTQRQQQQRRLQQRRKQQKKIKPPPPKKKQKILVTGAAGFVGSHVADYLLNRGDDVVIIDEVNNYYDVQIKESNLNMLQTKYDAKRVQIYRGDICNTTILDKIFIDHPHFDVICHMAARAGVRPSIEDPYVYVHSNIVGTVTLMEYARRHKIRNFVFASSSSVYGGSKSTFFSELEPVDHPISPYAMSKKSCELFSYIYQHHYGLNITALRFFTVYGPRGRPDMAPYKFIDRVSRNATIQQFGDGTSSRDYTYIDDIVQGVVKSIDKPTPYKILNLGKGSGTVLKEFLQMVERFVGQKAQIQILPDQPGDVPYTCANISIAQQHLGYQATVPFEQGIQRTVEWYKEAYGPNTKNDDKQSRRNNGRVTTTGEDVVSQKQKLRRRQRRRRSRSLSNQTLARRRRRKLEGIMGAADDHDDATQWRSSFNVWARAVMEDMTGALEDALFFDDDATNEEEAKLLLEVAAAAEALDFLPSMRRPHRRRRLQQDEGSAATEIAIVPPHTEHKKVLVTGGAGFLGSHVADFLLERGDSVVLVDQVESHDNLKYLQDRHGKAGRLTLHFGNIRDAEFMEDVFAKEKPEWICHLAALTNAAESLKHPVDYIHANIEGTLRLLELSKGKSHGGHDIRNFVLASSDSVYGRQAKLGEEYTDIVVRNEDDRVDYPKTPYAASKKTTELVGFTYHHLYQIPFSALRLFDVFGPRYRSDTIAYQLVDGVLKKNQRPIELEDHRNNEFTFVDDAVQAIVRALDRPYEYEIFNVGSGSDKCRSDRSAAVDNFADLVARSLGASVAPRPRAPATVDGISCANIQKSGKLLDYTPAVSLEEGIQRTIEWHTKTYYPHVKIPMDGPVDEVNSGGSQQKELDAAEAKEDDTHSQNDVVHSKHTESNDNEMDRAAASAKEKMLLRSAQTATTLSANEVESYFSAFPAWLRSLAFIQWLIVASILVVRAYCKANGTLGRTDSFSPPSSSEELNV